MEPVVRIVRGIRLAGHSIFFDPDREDGITPGEAWRRTLFRELRICDAVVFVNSKAGQESKWCHAELAVAAELGKRIYSLDLARGLAPHPLLQPLQGIRLEVALEASSQRLVDSLDADGLTGSSRLRWERGRPPYLGLAALEVADTGVFFGRENDMQGLLARVDRPLGQRGGDLVVVVGPNGAGKSSLVRAGLAARLELPRSGVNAGSGCLARGWQRLANGCSARPRSARSACSLRWIKPSNWPPSQRPPTARNFWSCSGRAWALGRWLPQAARSAAPGSARTIRFSPWATRMKAWRCSRSSRGI
jgi:hypothetical protein